MGLLYEKTAGILLQQIENGSLQAGDKLPSIRQLSKKLKVSIGTVQQAYALLEDRQWITPKERSGYYVSPPQRIPIDSPQTPLLTTKPSSVEITENAMSVVITASKKKLTQLGPAIPNLEGTAIKQIQKSLLKYASVTPNQCEDPQGYLPLRQQLARRSISTGKAFSADEVVITSGCQEALDIALRCIAKEGDIIAVESPCYHGGLHTLEVLGMKVVEVPVIPDRGIDLRRLEELILRWPVKAILLNPTFSNPTGYSCSDEAKQAIVHMLEQYDLPLIEDDIFAELGWAESRPRSIQSFDRDGRVILCSSISKTLSQDLRVGWMVPGRYTEKARTLKFVSSLCCASLQQFALADFLSTQRFERHLRWVTAEYCKRQQILLTLIQQYFPEGTHATQPQGGFVCWVKLPENIDGMKLYQDALASGISITPGEIYSPTRHFKNFIRLSYGVISENKMEWAIKELARLINNEMQSDT